MGGMPLARVRLAIHGLNTHAPQQGRDVPPPKRMAFSPEQIAQHPGSSKRMVQREFVNPAHQYQIRDRHGRRLVLRGRPREPQELALPHDW